MENKISKRSVALGESEINIVTHLSSDRAFYNFSLALRTIIHEWEACNGNGHRRATDVEPGPVNGEEEK
jgi:hypothetical protein